MTYERVVLIDDNETDNFFHRFALKRAGFTGELLVFERPAEGMAFLLNDQASVPTCVFLDINMPQFSGFDVAQTLDAQLKPGAPFKLLMLTSSNWSEDRRRAKSIPLIKGFLVKPLTAAAVGPLLSDLAA